jgi:hypothetical protein
MKKPEIKNLAPLFLYHFLFLSKYFVLLLFENWPSIQTAVISLSAPGCALLATKKKNKN